MNIFGTIARFNSSQDILNAAKRLKTLGYNSYEAYTPFPVHGLDDACNLSASKLPFISLVSGIIGLCTGVILQVWGSTWGYQVIVSGKPDGWHALFSFIPIVFELTILFTAFGTILGMFFLNNLGIYHHNLFKYEIFKRVTNDSFFIVLFADDKNYQKEQVQKTLKELKGNDVTILEK